MSLEKLVNEYEAFGNKKAELVKEMRVHFPPLLEKVFEMHPWVEEVTWRQCEPWNDGEETEFEVLAKPHYLYINDLNTYDDGVYGVEEKQRAFADFSEAIMEVPADVMKEMFGESNEVKIKRGGHLEVTDYKGG